ncbi:MAG: RHS repeat domain-containing protein [Bacteroidales bacterium]
MDSDHLGSSSFITDASGITTQHLQYLPFGETFVEQSSNAPYNTPYKFSGKEKDEETGYSYFGARYLITDFSIWGSVDPMAEKGPSVSPYTYCFNNPIILKDPDGEWPGFIHRMIINLAL